MNLHLYPSPFVAESRMLKELTTIVDRGLSGDLIVMAVQAPGLPRSEAIAPARRVIRLPIRTARMLKGKAGKVAALLEYCARALLFGIRRKPAVINCHSLNVLSVGVLLKRLGRTERVIYNARELETERETLRGMAKRLSKWLERALMPHVDHVIVVSPPIADWYRDAYPGKPVSVVRNVPRRQPAVMRTTVFRDRWNIPADALIYLYQGVLSDARGVAVLIDAFRQADTSHLVLMGYGPAEEAIRAAERDCDRIHFCPAVPPTDILRHTASADIGIFFLPGVPSLSYRYSLPNKFYEYLYAGCPVLVSANLQFLTSEIAANDLGWIIEPDVAALVGAINGIQRSAVGERAAAVAAYAAGNCWEDDEPEIVRAFAA